MSHRGLVTCKIQYCGKRMQRRSFSDQWEIHIKEKDVLNGIQCEKYVLKKGYRFNLSLVADEVWLIRLYFFNFSWY